jgi:hypothetical protein
MAVFETDIGQLALRTGQAVPPFFEKLISFLLDKDRLATEGIFRISAIRSLLDRFQRDINISGDVVLPDDTDAHVAANLITRFIGAIPGRIGVNARANEWEKIKTVADAKELFESLPLVNRALLSRTVGLFTMVLRYPENRMGAQALARILLPSLVEKADPWWLLDAAIPTILIEHYAEVFASMPAVRPDGTFMTAQEFHNSIDNLMTEFFCVSAVPGARRVQPVSSVKAMEGRMRRNVAVKDRSTEEILNSLLTFDETVHFQEPFVLTPLLL